MNRARSLRMASGRTVPRMRGDEPENMAESDHQAACSPTQPAAVLLGQSESLISLASAAGYRCFTSPEAFRKYSTEEIEQVTGT